jgi:hypothetical protein
MRIHDRIFAFAVASLALLGVLLAGLGCGRVTIAPNDGGASGGTGGDPGSGGNPTSIRGKLDGGAGSGSGGVDGSTVDTGPRECTPGDRKCDPSTNAPVSCDDNGTWQTGNPCDHLCMDGACTGACTPGQGDCIGNIPETCNANGQWQTGTACRYLCGDGGCTGMCTPGDRKCGDNNGNNNARQTCDSTGTWQTAETCRYVCQDGLCTGVCAPGTMDCNGNTPETCDSNGTWQLGSPCMYVCSKGGCAGGCTPGDHQCANNVLQTCTTAGAWQDTTTCQYVCAQQQCTGQCVPTTQQCMNGQLQVCDSTGTWQTTGTSTLELLRNPSFDDGDTVWTSQSLASITPIINLDDGTFDVAAQSAPYFAWLGGYNNASDVLSQTVTVPASTSSLMLSFYFAVVTSETTAASEFDTMNVALVTAQQTYQLAHFSNLSANSNWTRFTTVVPSTLAGQTVTLRFKAATDPSFVTSFYVDTVSIQAVACP